ncbi:MAG TPA: hypothetical protein PK295_00225 [Candidatus Magasanikbacteria bacterium]|nr:hypothetical protein [Candidatus Magasanikbacteria bacterium]
MKKVLLFTIFIVVLGFTGWYVWKNILWFRAGDPGGAMEKARTEAIDRVLDARRARVEENKEVDPFGEDGIVRVLLIGLDKRVGQTTGHCDVIQMITIDTKQEKVTITAVPRGTYSPLPPGTGVTSSDYYVSNSCGLGGIEYGINQIEKILGMKADYLVIVGFSETLGVLRSLRLPTTETLQWLRQRHAYAIGEPQRAHNHSTFLKQMLLGYVPDEPSKMDKALHYVVYKIVKTDLSFDEAEAIVTALSKMKISEHSDNITLAMRPAHTVADIPYIPDELEEYLDSTLGRIKGSLGENDYSGTSRDQIQKTLLDMIEAKKKDPQFITWAFENNLWLQIEDEPTRLQAQYDFLKSYLKLEKDEAKRKTLIADYTLEMEHGGQEQWAVKGRELLAEEIEKK